MEAIGRLAGGIAHDFNNLLTVILAATEVVSDDASVRGAVAEHLEAVRQAATRGAALTRQLLVLSRHNPPDSKLLDVSAQIRRTVPIMRRLLGEDIEIRVELTDGLRPVRIDPSQLDQILLNLAINARDAMPRGGRLVFATSAGEGDRSMELTVTDDGTGMSAETRERAFEPFFTTKPEGSGTGLGLATVYGIVKQRGGEIAIESAPDRGTRFRITLPTAEPRDAEDEPVARQERPAPAGALVLVVEDEPSVRRIVRRILESAGHRVLEAGSGAEALELAHRAERPLDALVTDVVMPGMSGPELTKRLRAEQPGLAVLLMSGYLGDVLAQHGVGSDVALLEKPFAPSILLDALGRALAQSPRSASTSSS
jgi:CheY-like chemotaxis protein/two-component sensor histidine kinase